MVEWNGPSCQNNESFRKSVYNNKKIKSINSNHFLQSLVDNLARHSGTSKGEGKSQQVMQDLSCQLERQKVNSTNLLAAGEIKSTIRVLHSFLEKPGEKIGEVEQAVVQGII